MPAGLTSKLNILQRSPHDASPCSNGTSNGASQKPARVRWLPSRYTIRAVSEDGRLVLWNTKSGSMNLFEADQRPQIETLLKRSGVVAERKGLIKYLHQRGYLIREEVDEYQQVELAFGQQHYRTDVLELILLASEDCNFRCEYCYEKFERGTMRPEVRQAVRRLVEKRIGKLNHLHTSWFGGEPLYGFAAIEELAPFFANIAKEHDISHTSHITSNGYLLTSEVSAKLLEWGVGSYQITIDGTPDDHNRTRPTREGGETFHVIFENLKALARHDNNDFVVDIRVNFDQNNHKRLTSFLDLLETEFGNDSRFRLRFRAVGKLGGPNDEDLAICGLKESDRIIREVRAEAKRRGLNISDPLKEASGLGSQVCYAARPFNYIIGADGQVMKCTVDLDAKDRNVVGQLTADGDLELNANYALWTEPAFQHDTKCQKCVVLPVCQGISCPQIRFDEGISPCTPLRRTAKYELLSTLANQEEKGRTVQVGASGPVPSASSEKSHQTLVAGG